MENVLICKHAHRRTRLSKEGIDTAGRLMWNKTLTFKERVGGAALHVVSLVRGTLTLRRNDARSGG